MLPKKIKPRVDVFSKIMPTKKDLRQWLNWFESRGKKAWIERAPGGGGYVLKVFQKWAQDEDCDL